MTRGIASFMESNDFTSSSHSIATSGSVGIQQKVAGPFKSSRSDLSVAQDAKGDPSIHSETLEHVPQNHSSSLQGLLKSEPIEEPLNAKNSDTPTRPAFPPASGFSSLSSEQSIELDLDALTRRLFDKAATVARNSIENDGTIFVRANLTEHSSLDRPSLSASNSNDEAGGDANGDDNDVECPILGASISVASRNTVVGQSIYNMKMTDKLLSSLLKRFPTGKLFVYDDNGTPQYCSSSNESESGATPASLTEGMKSQRARYGSSLHFENTLAEALSKYFPGARSVAFVPIRDDTKERWFAGGFAYTTDPTRVFTMAVELGYLRALSTLIMAELHRIEVTLAHKAKADILSSLSHELRSPLHGVILSTELLADTQLDVFQANLIHTLETCGRTLLDTIDHLLDFSKINNYLKSVKAEKRVARGHRIHAATSIEAGMKNLYSDICLDVLVEEVVDSVFAGHNFQYISVSQVSRRDHLPANIRANSHSDFTRAMEDLDITTDDSGQLQLPIDHVSVYLDIDAHVSSFRFSSMAGAIRRIVMNLFGNALKYTNAGKIHVSLSVDPETKKTVRSNQRVARLTVKDTGRGIGADFMRNGLYKPFHQADQLSPGTGLGLSLVKKIVTSLGGTISITSELEVGTTVTVLLPLFSLSAPATGDAPEQQQCREIDDLRQKLGGLRVRLAGFETNDGAVTTASGANQRTGLDLPIKKICREWLQMVTITESHSGHIAPDLLLCSEAGWHELRENNEMWNNPPVVVVCANALVAHKKSRSSNGATGQGIYEFISQPQV